MTAGTDALWRLLLQQVAEGIAIVEARDPFRIVEANRALHALQADPTQPLAGRPWAAAFPQAAARGLVEHFRQVAASGESARSGGAVWDWRCLPLPPGEHQPACLLVIVNEVTDRGVCEHLPGLTLELLRHMPVGVVTTSGPEHTIVIANPYFARLTGRPGTELTGQPLFTAVPELHADGFAAMLARTYQSREPLSIADFAFQASATSAPSFWNLVVMPLPLPHDDDGLLLMAVDTTAQAQARHEVEELAAAARKRAGQLEAIIGSMIDGVFVLDAQGLVIEANEAALALLDLPSVVQSQRLTEYLTRLAPRHSDGRSLAPDADFLAGVLAGVLAGDVLTDAQLLLGGAGTRARVVSLTAAPVREGDGRIGGAVVLVRDITAQKRTEQEKDAFLSLISHEVKSPLTSIKGFAQLATRTAEQEHAGSRVSHHLQVIEQQVARIDRLVNELSDADRLQKGTFKQEPVTFDLAALTRTIVEQQQVTVTTHTLRLTLADEPLLVYADPARIEQVLTNLLTNAVKYSPEADHVTIALGSDGSLAHLRVCDKGIGIPRAEQGRLFGRFYRTTNAATGGFGGLGLGLFVAYEIVAGSGGRIWVESAEHQGSTFHVTLPLALDE